MATTVAGRPAGRLRTIQNAADPERVWAKLGAMVGLVIGLNVLGWDHAHAAPVTIIT